MSYSNYNKVFKQLRQKPAKLTKYIKHNQPIQRKFGKGSRRCRLCDRLESHIQKYNLGLCRHCFRENAKTLGFKKFS
jgi:ribosomal protein S14